MAEGRTEWGECESAQQLARTRRGKRREQGGKAEKQGRNTAGRAQPASLEQTASLTSGTTT
eukprot:9495614-Pyramimonas_sp.AAC.2